MAKWKIQPLRVALLQRSAERAAVGEPRITHSEIAKATGLPLPTVSAYLAGNVENPNLDKLAKIADFLGVSVLSLIDVDGEDTETEAGNQNRRQRSGVLETQPG